MKKLTKRIICIMLAVLMLSGTCVSFAARAKDYSGYKVYVVLGDSIAAGIGENNRNNKFFYRTPGAYPDIIANNLGAECIPLCCAGSRTVELRACLEKDYVMPDNISMTMDQAKVDELKDAFVPAIKKADIITLNIGANDIATYALLIGLEYASKLGISVMSVNSAVSPYEEKGDFTGAIASLISLAEKAGVAAQMVNAIIKGLYVGYDRFSENWDAIMRDIFRLNPDVTMMVAGLYNPFEHVKLKSESLLEIGKAFNGIVDLLNAKMQYGSRYAWRYHYVDISGIESLFTANKVSFLDADFISGAVLNVHPSLKGHAQIAERFMAQIPEKHACNSHLSDIFGLLNGLKKK